jgi:hypothetical protein
MQRDYGHDLSIGGEDVKSLDRDGGRRQRTRSRHRQRLTGRPVRTNDQLRGTVAGFKLRSVPTSHRDRRAAVASWRTARAELGAAADALAACIALDDLVEHNRRIAGAGAALRGSQVRMTAAHASRGRIARWTLGQRRRKDAALEARVAAIILRRKAASRVSRRSTQDFPAHDWLKDAWR